MLQSHVSSPLLLNPSHFGGSLQNLPSVWSWDAHPSFLRLAEAAVRVRGDWEGRSPRICALHRALQSAPELEICLPSPLSLPAVDMAGLGAFTH